MSHNLYKAAVPHLKTRPSGLSVLQGLVLTICITAFALWCMIYAPDNRWARILLYLYVWPGGALFLLGGAILGFTLKNKDNRGLVSNMIWQRSWHWSLQILYHASGIGFDLVLVYCLYRLRMPMSAWFLLFVHVVAYYAFIYPKVGRQCREQIKRLVPASKLQPPVAGAQVDF